MGLGPLDSLGHEHDEHLADEIGQLLLFWGQAPFLSRDVNVLCDVFRDISGIGVNLIGRDEPCASLQASVGIEQVLMEPAFLFASGVKSSSSHS